MKDNIITKKQKFICQACNLKCNRKPTVSTCTKAKHNNENDPYMFNGEKTSMDWTSLIWSIASFNLKS